MFSIPYPNLISKIIRSFTLFQLHRVRESGGEAALSTEDLHLVLGLPSEMLKVQNPDQNHLQNRGKGACHTLDQYFSLCQASMKIIKVFIVNITEVLPGSLKVEP